MAVYEDHKMADGHLVGTNAADTFELAFDAPNTADNAATIYGRGGDDVADFGSVLASAVTLTKLADGFTVAKADGVANKDTFTLKAVEAVKFANGTITSGASASAPQYLQKDATDKLYASGVQIGDLSDVQKWDGAGFTAANGEWKVASVNGAAPAAGVVVIAGLGVATITNAGGGADDVLKFALTKTGVTFGEKVALTITYTDGVNTFTQTYNLTIEASTDGNDKFTATEDTPADFDGGKGDDKLLGGEGRNELNGQEGNDTIFAGAEGDDVALENDQFTGGAGNDRIGGGKGGDLLVGDDYVVGGAGDLTADGKDTIYGADGDDMVVGGSWRDANTDGDVDAGELFGIADDVLWAGNGADTVVGAGGNDKIGAGAGDDLISGGAGHDTIYGADGNDTVVGGNGNDLIYGGNGNDKLAGDSGLDTIEGGAGNDQIDLLDTDDAVDTVIFAKGFGQDTVINFGAEDKLDVSAFKTSFAALKISYEDTDGNGLADSAVVDFGNGDEMIIKGLDGTAGKALVADDFVF